MKRALLVVALILGASSNALAQCDCGQNDPTEICQGQSVSYQSRTGAITYNFQCDGGNCRCGVFANLRDYWVAPARDNGTVTITGMTPAQTGTGAATRNGAQVDPANTLSQQGLTGPLAFSAALNVRPPYSVNTGAVGRPVSLLKARTHAVTAQPGYESKCNEDRACLEHVEVLTILPKPALSVFRPPYFGTEKPMVPFAQFSSTRLPSVLPAGGEMGWADAIDIFNKPPFDHIWNWNTRELFHANQNYGTPQSGYDAYVAQREQGALLRASLRPANPSEGGQKELLARGIAQRGIDLYHIFKNGGGIEGGSRHTTCGGWFGTGGYGTGRLPIILTSIELLGQQATWGAHLRNILATEEGRQCFAETSIIQPANGAGRNIPLWGHKRTAVYSPARTSRTLADPNSRIDGGGNPETGCVAAYQQCCTTAALQAGATAIFLSPTLLQSVPAGARHWLDWVDRISTVGAYCNPNTATPTRYTPASAAPGAAALYQKYRVPALNK